jgi:prophage regulatory protein
MNAKLLRIDEVLVQVPLSKSTLLRQVAEGRFPAPIRLGARRVAWLETEIATWREARIAARDEPSVAGQAA